MKVDRSKKLFHPHPTLTSTPSLMLIAFDIFIFDIFLFRHFSFLSFPIIPLKEASLKLSLKLNPERFITDFESGIIKAVRKEVGRCFYSLKINCVGFFLQKSGA